MKKKIVFMGTPGFAVGCLKELANDFEIEAVITAPDRPAGRGRKIKESDVKIAAKELGIQKILQPEKLKEESFLAELDQLEAELYVVVAFRMLPEVVWKKPSLGTINLHGSLLPNYRGAAPINWAIINGEKKSGATTFFINEKIDTGNIIDKVELEITNTDNAGTFHDKLMQAGSVLLKNTVHQIFDANVTETPQANIIDIDKINDAPKIFKNTCEINWNESPTNIYNHIRGLSPYPASWTTLINENKEEITAKIFEAEIIEDNTVLKNIYTDGKTYLHIGINENYSIKINSIQIAGKKRLKTEDLLRGFQINNHWKIK